MFRIGFDVGGTFTDFTVQNTANGSLFHVKVPSTPSDPARAIADGLARLVSEHSLDAARVIFVGHGTTVATNMVIEHKGAKTGLITTKGCRDVLEIGRQTRPALYDYSVRNPEPLVPRRRRLEVEERLDATGDLVTALDQADLADKIKNIIDQDVEAIAVCFLHSYANPSHERLTREAIRSSDPTLYVSVSSDVLPEFREFERTSTTVLNAYVGPRMAGYLDQFGAQVAEFGIPVEPYTIHSNGGVISIATARDCPVRTCLSGPAAGVVGAARISRNAGYSNVISFDVGGTSTDVSLIRDGTPLFTSSRSVAGYPMKCPMVDVHVIGAGGGSIAQVDDAGGLSVGPRSAGAAPGPAAYGQGGTLPTLTDANLVLGRLCPAGLVGGDMPLHVPNAMRAIEFEIAEPLNMQATEAADGIVSVAVSNMSRAIRSVSTERGYDLAEFALIAYGGAGPLHAVAVASDLGIDTVIVPREPGTLCARGILISDISFDYVVTVMRICDATTWPVIFERFTEMREQGQRWLESEGVAPGQQRFDAVVDARYFGQNHEVTIPVGLVADDDPGALLESFGDVHNREHGYELENHAVEIVNCRLKAIGISEVAKEAPVADAISTQGSSPTDRRRVHFGPEAGWHETLVFDRSSFGPGTQLIGPCIIEEMSATSLIPPGHRAEVDAAGNIIIRIGPLS